VVVPTMFPWGEGKAIMVLWGAISLGEKGLNTLRNKFF